MYSRRSIYVLYPRGGVFQNQQKNYSKNVKVFQHLQPSVLTDVNNISLTVLNFHTKQILHISLVSFYICFEQINECLFWRFLVLYTPFYIFFLFYISSYSVRIRENTNQKNSEHGYFSRCGYQIRIVMSPFNASTSII